MYRIEVRNLINSFFFLNSSHYFQIYSANILSSLSDTIDPCDDFFEYACQNWIKAYPMPKGKSTWGTLFKRGERTSHEVRQILEAPIDSNVPFSGQLKRIYEAHWDLTDF